MKSLLIIMSLVCCVVAGCATRSSDIETMPSQPTPKQIATWAKANAQWETSIAPGGAHYIISRLVGNWKGRCKLWKQPNNLESNEPVTLSARQLLDGRFVHLEYETTLAGHPTSGAMTVGYDFKKKAYSCAWIDKWRVQTETDLMYGEQLSDTSFTVRHVGNVAGWNFRWVFEVVNDDDVTLTYYLQPPGGNEYKSEEKKLTRVK